MNGAPNWVALRDIDRSARPYACCREPQNLRCEQKAGDLFIERCSCGRSHHVMEVDPVPLGVAGGAL